MGYVGGGENLNREPQGRHRRETRARRESFGAQAGGNAAARIPSAVKVSSASYGVWDVDFEMSGTLDLRGGAIPKVNSPETHRQLLQDPWDFRDSAIALTFD